MTEKDRRFILEDAKRKILTQIKILESQWPLDGNYVMNKDEAIRLQSRKTVDHLRMSLREVEDIERELFSAKTK